MKEKLVTYSVELNYPESFVVFQAEKDLSENQILERAIEELTRKTSLWSVKMVVDGVPFEKVITS